MSNEITVDAVFENGVFRPSQPVSLSSPQAVTLKIQVIDKKKVTEWPSDVAQIYRELADEDRKLAEAMIEHVRTTWPANEGLHE
jgi:predicted DNA-binding antitoxin AbrB/MazE fold protein